MGYVKARMAINNTKEISIGTAIIQVNQSGTFTNIRDAEGLAYYTIHGRLKGCQPRRRLMNLSKY